MIDSADKPKVKLAELYDLVVNYAKQQTIDPIRGVGRWLLFGLIAAVLMSIGLVLGALGVLRLIQTTAIGVSNSWSWTGYLITIVVCIAVGWLAVSRIRRGTLAK
ncbi:MAG: hypothetical protein HQ486_01400 [Acidimicrobiaceae bacterium]|nr:hypothetical protein [Acidimicrobiaceae bacterium]